MDILRDDLSFGDYVLTSLFCLPGSRFCDVYTWLFDVNLSRLT